MSESGNNLKNHRGVLLHEDDYEVIRELEFAAHKPFYPSESIVPPELDDERHYDDFLVNVKFTVKDHRIDTLQMEFCDHIWTDSNANMRHDFDYFEKLTDLKRLYVLFYENDSHSSSFSSSFPSGFAKPPSLEKFLFLSNRNLKIPPYITEMNNLKVLKIEGSRIENLEEVFSLNHLESLSLKGWGIKLLPEIGNFHALKEIYIQNSNKYAEGTDLIWDLESIERLILGYADAEAMNRIQSLDNLKVLEIKQVDKELPPITRLPDLEELCINISRYDQVPECIKECAHLRKLHLYFQFNPKIREMPTWIRELTGLEDLALINHIFTKIPSWLGDLKGLRHLEISGVLIDPVLPDSLGKLENLNTLILNSLNNSVEQYAIRERNHYMQWYVDNMGTIALPSSIVNLNLLKRLEIKNSMVVFPENFGEGGAPESLEEFILDYCLFQMIDSKVLEDLAQKSIIAYALEDNEAEQHKVIERIRERAQKQGLDLFQRIIDGFDSYAARNDTYDYDTDDEDDYTPCLDHYRELYLKEIEQVVNKVKLCRLSNLFCRITSLKRISITRSHLGPLPERFGDLKRLEVLDVEHNSMNKHLPESIGGLARLQYLKGAYLNKNDVPSSFWNLRSLRTLPGVPNLDSIPQDWKGFPEVTMLRFWFDNLHEHNNLFFGLPSLEYMKGRKSKLPEIPPAILDCTRLRELDIQQTGLESLPENIGKLINLEYLDVYRNDIEAIPESFGNLKALCFLNLQANNRISSVPDTFGDLESLEYLNFSLNAIERLPACLGRLSRLRKLRLRCSGLKSIPPEFCKLENLEDLLIAWASDLEYLPACFGKLRNLKFLEIWQTGLKEFPESLGDLESLRGLRIEKNQITGFPDSIGNLTNLQYIQAYKNNIKRLPASMGRLENLRQLDVRVNEIEEYPTFLKLLPSMESISCDANQIKAAGNEEEIGETFQALKLKYDTEHKESDGEVTSFKLIESAGKGALVNNLTGWIESASYAEYALLHALLEKDVKILNEALYNLLFMMDNKNTVKIYYERFPLFGNFKELIPDDFETDYEQFRPMIREFLETEDEKRNDERKLAYINDIAWFFIRQETAMGYVRASGLEVMDFGRDVHEKWPYYGKDLIATSLSFSESRADLEEAKTIYEEILEYNENYCSKDYYQQILEKLKNEPA